MPSIETILGVPFFNGTVDDAVGLMSTKRGLLVVPAAPSLVKICDDAEYRRALLASDLAIADSGAMVLFWKIFRGRSVERISGLKYLKCLVARLASHPNERVLWIVPSETAHGKTIAWLRSVSLSSAADLYVAPRYGTEVRDDALLNKIDHDAPTHVIVGIGGGVQEKLGLFLKENLQIKSAIHCIGAALAFLTGDQPPIPTWADRFYLGWLLRSLRQPRTFAPRYLSAVRLPWLLLRYRQNLPPLRSRQRSEV
jgi:UDP-N-acetyl-D-mannosaminuronic acid transferase (WecB/TagA/CpsF family)